MTPDEPIQLKGKDLKPLREKMLKEQEGFCPITKVIIDSEQAVVDHCHDSGFVRAVLSRSVNTAEGKCRGAWIRFAKNTGISYGDFLRNLADYVDQQHTNLIHPTEAPKPIKLGKRIFAKIKKEYPKLTYPKSGKVTKGVLEKAIKCYEAGILTKEEMQKLGYTPEE